MGSIRNTYHHQDRDSSVNSRQVTPANGTDPASLPTYYEARNLRPSSSDPLSRDAMNNLKGTLLRMDLNNYWYFDGATWIQTTYDPPPPSPYHSDMIIGVGNIRGLTYFLSTAGESLTPTTDIGTLWRVNLHASDPQDTLYRLWTGALGLSRRHPILNEIIGRYENADVQKLYWADGYNNLRFANVADSNKDALAVQDVSDFNLVNEVLLSKPTLSAMTSGTLKTGVVQYAYRLYKLNGPESVFSPASGLIHLTDKSEMAQNTSKYRGQSALDEDGVKSISGKGVEVQIDNIDTRFDRIEVVAIHYTSIIDDPTINVVGRFTAATSLRITDDGTYNQGTYSLNEFRTLGGLIFVPQTISSKDNKLFAGNLNIKSWNPTWDARAYRFDYLNNCRLYNSAGSLEYTIYGDNPLYEGGVYTSWLNIPETADCVNIYNNLDNDLVASARYRYQTNGFNLGGEGPNIKYTFGTKDIRIDDNYHDTDNFVTKETTSANPSFRDYASPFIKETYIGYQRDETYRIGIVFHNTYGQEAPAKWMGDVRFPAGHNGAAYQIASFSSFSYGRALKLVVELKSMPTDAVGWHIVRVKREEKDKTVVAQGLFGPWYSASGHQNEFRHSFDLNWGNTLTKFHFMSPEINFYKTLSVGSDDYIESIGSCRAVNATKVYNWIGARQYEPILKLREIYPSGRFAKPKILEGEIQEPTDNDEDTTLAYNLQQETRTVDGDEFYMRCNQLYQNGNPKNWTYYTQKGTCFVGNLNSIITDSSLLGSGYLFVNYRRKASQYGGDTYNARTTNIYIPCSEIFFETAPAGPFTGRDIWGGDTYICMYDYSYAEPFWTTIPFSSGTVAENHMQGLTSTIYFPCETTINLPLRHDDCYSRIKGTIFAALLKEKNNTFFRYYDLWAWDGEWDTLITHRQESTKDWTNLYLYNSVYSKDNDSKIFVPPPMDYVDEKIVDTLVVASREKYNGEERDNWLRFDTDERKEVDSQWGPLIELITFKNHLIFFQEDGIGTLSVNERALLENVTQAALELGTGKVLDRYDMLATNTGVQMRGRVVQSPMGFYWADLKRKEFQRYSSQLMNISVIKGADSWFKAIDDSFIYSEALYDSRHNLDIENVFLGYDPTFKEVLINRKDSLGSGETMVYNEVRDEFTSIFDYNNIMYYFNADYRTFAIRYSGQIYELNVGAYNDFFDEVFNADPSIIYIINPLRESVCVFNTYEFALEMYNSLGANLVDGMPETIRMENDYQDSGIQTLVADDNIKRRIRTWRFIDFRDETSLARMRDTYLKLTLTFNGDDAQKIVLHPLTSHYVVPAESLAP